MCRAAAVAELVTTARDGGNKVYGSVYNEIAKGSRKANIDPRALQHVMRPQQNNKL